MKLKYLIGTFFSLAIASCTNFLEREPISTSNSETYFKSIQDVELTLVGTYSALQSDDAYGNLLPIILSCGTDEAIYSRPYNSWTTSYYQHTSSTEDIRKVWRGLYYGISQANMTLHGLEQVEGSAEEKVRIEAEAKTLRAMFYLDLLRLFENIPLILTPTTDTNLEKLQVSQAEPMEVYQQLIEDLQFATKNLPWSDEGETGKVNKALAHGLLTRIYQDLAGEQMSKFSTISKEECNKLVVSHADTVINYGYHVLNNDYAQIFKNLAESIVDPREVIFQVNFANLRSDGLVEGGKHGNLNGPSTNFNSIYEPFAYAYEYTSILHVNAYEYSSVPDWEKPGSQKDSILDTRYTWNIANFKYLLEDQSNPNSKKIVKFLSNTDKAQNEYYPGKFRRMNHHFIGMDEEGDPIYDVETLEVGPITKNETNIDFPYMRIAEIYLNKAEAEYTLGNLAGAKESINVIRRRAGLEDYRLNDEQLWTSIQNERLKELCYEGFRKRDLIRWGILYDKLQDLKQAMQLSGLDPSSSKYFLFRSSDYIEWPKHSVLPIPNREITNNPKLVQHPYWQ